MDVVGIFHFFLSLVNFCCEEFASCNNRYRILLDFASCRFQQTFKAFWFLEMLCLFNRSLVSVDVKVNRFFRDNIACDYPEMKSDTTSEKIRQFWKLWVIILYWKFLSLSNGFQFGNIFEGMYQRSIILVFVWQSRYLLATIKLL